MGTRASRINPAGSKWVFRPYRWWAETRNLKPNGRRSELLFDQVLAEVSTELLILRNSTGLLVATKINKPQV